MPEKVVRRASMVPFGSEGLWVDQIVSGIGADVAHHRRGDERLASALHGAQALLALLTLMVDRESVPR